jgi:type I restriction enzyme S subunit
MATNNNDKTLNVPHLRFPEFSGEWEIYPLTDFMSFKNGMNPDAKRFGRGTKFISVMDILNNQFICYDNIRASVEVVDGDIETYGVNYGDILFQRSSETLEDVGQANVYLDSKPAVFGGFVIRGKSKSNYYPMFFRYLLASPTARKKIIVKGAGAQHFNIGQDGLSKVCLNIPSIQEQEKIAKLFECIDTRIATQNKIIEKYESLIQAMCDTLIESEQHKVELSFSDFGESYSGLSGKSAEDFGEGCPYITYMNVNQNQIIDTTNVGLVKINEAEQQSVVRYGDILFTLSSETPEEVGMGAVYLGKTYPLYLNSFCFGVHIIDESKIFPPFLAYYISTQSFRKAVYPLAQGSTRFNLQKSDFMKKVFPFPIAERQNKIYSVLKTYSDKLSAEKSIAKLFCEQKNYLLRQLFI